MAYVITKPLLSYHGKDAPAKLFKNIVVRGPKLAYFKNGAWHPRKRRTSKPDNPAAIIRHLLIQYGFASHPHWRNIEHDLGKLYLYAEGKVKGFIAE